jgi:hypothetical protein
MFNSMALLQPHRAARPIPRAPPRATSVPTLSAPKSRTPAELQDCRELSCGRRTTGGEAHSTLRSGLEQPAQIDVHLSPAACATDQSHPLAARTHLQALLSPARPPIKRRVVHALRRTRSLPALLTQCFRCLATDHLVADCRDPVRCRASSQRPPKHPLLDGGRVLPCALAALPFARGGSCVTSSTHDDARRPVLALTRRRQAPTPGNIASSPSLSLPRPPPSPGARAIPHRSLSPLHHVFFLSSSSPSIRLACCHPLPPLVLLPHLQMLPLSGTASPRSTCPRWTWVPVAGSPKPSWSLPAPTQGTSSGWP